MTRKARKPTELYARLYCSILANEKLIERSHLAWRLYASAFAWCRQKGNDGQVPTGALLACIPGESKRKLNAAAEELVDAGLWTLNGAGWVIHDYLDWQDGSEQIAANRDKAKHAAEARWD
jgi:hypothetical protein